MASTGRRTCTKPSRGGSEVSMGIDVLACGCLSGEKVLVGGTAVLCGGAYGRIGCASSKYSVHMSSVQVASPPGQDRAVSVPDALCESSSAKPVRGHPLTSQVVGSAGV